ncbi:Metallo-hydrolase/oxidoreductase [Obba rivulosa]|uniref:Metallo-hydrolase/oxidoreductase n=1 Tax=Obba rivulosa TaxID=1052685 RepID=A0A8E2DKN0_9APHY|nr:Metallo-hydrolase/oxidoreductase [Obba rivulosa]
MSLPPPSENQAYCDASALVGGHVQIPLRWVLDNARDDEVNNLPGLSFLLRHTTNGDTFIVDLGIRRDWDTALPTPLIDRIKHMGFVVDVPQDVPTSLRKGGVDPHAAIRHVLLTHVHFDHFGDTAPFTHATFLVGSEAQQLVTPGWPADPHSAFPGDLLPPGRTKYLSREGLKPIGPFPHALDFYGDGSLYIVDAPGHLPGHINVLVRTSPDGGWLYLAGDSAHDHRLIDGEAQIAVTDMFGCAHQDKEVAAEHIARIRALKANSRVRVLIAHDAPWYWPNRGGPAFLPGKLESL